MDRYEIYFKLREFCCKSPYCSICQIRFYNPQHKCGNGYGYFLDGNPVPLLEAFEVLLYYIWRTQFEEYYREKKGEL